MSKFTKRVTKIYEFDGDTVTVVMRRLKRKDAVKLSPFMKEPDENGIVSMTTEESFEFVNAASKILDKYVESITGLNDDSGEPIPKEEVLGEEEGESYFMELLSQMVNDLMKSSFLQKSDEKKLDAPSDDSLGVAAETQAALTSEGNQ